VFMCLPLASKALAPLLWLLASESKDGSFDADFDELEFRLRINSKDIAAGLKPLIDKGFFIDASGMLAQCLQDATPEREREAEAKTEKKPARKRATKTPLPENFAISDRVAEWAKQHGHTRLDEHLDVFKRKCIANAYTYASWDDAFMEAVRGDWAKLNQPVRLGFANPADVARVTVPSKPDRDPVLVKLEQEALKAVGPTPEQRARMEELRRQARVSTDGQPHKTT
jgi:hypothetical protein